MRTMKKAKNPEHEKTIHDFAAVIVGLGLDPGRILWNLVIQVTLLDVGETADDACDFAIFLQTFDEASRWNVLMVLAGMICEQRRGPAAAEPPRALRAVPALIQ